MCKFLKDLWLVHVERAKARKAARLLIKQEWSIEFLTLLLVKSVQIKKSHVGICLKNKDGQVLCMNADMPEVVEAAKQDKSVDVLAQNVTLDAILDVAWEQGLM